jgi:hypothetical protein
MTLARLATSYPVGILNTKEVMEIELDHTGLLEVGQLAFSLYVSTDFKEEMERTGLASRYIFS